MAIKWINFLRVLTKEKNVINLSDLAKKIANNKNVAIFCHIRPDGDTIGSALSLKKAIQSLGAGAEVYCDDTVPSRFLFLNECKTIKNNLNGEYDALIAIDCADSTRLGSFCEYFLSHKNTFNIDHHVSNNRYGKENYIVDNAANCENVYDLITELGVKIDSEMANLLLLGIVTDTGAFKHKNVTEKSLYIASKLVSYGADLNAITYNMFSAQSKERANLFGKTMSKIRYFLDGRFAIASVFLSSLEQTGAKADETEGFVDFVLGIDGVKVAVCMLEMSPNKFKISFRSKGPNVNAVASTFGGGGHVLASGCQIQGEYEEVVDKLTFAVSRELID